jgi:catechol 2,3-dioxygenase-like lactoylglutathione lyase family enzyme
MWSIEVTLCSNDIDATNRLLGPGLGLARLREGSYVVGQSVVSVRPASAENPSGVAYLTLHGDDVNVALDQLRSRGYSGADKDGLPEVVIEGVRVRLTEQPLAVEGATVQEAATSALRIDHFGIASDNSVHLSKVVDDVLGFHYESRQIDTQLEVPIEMFSSDRYGVVSHAQRPRPAGALLVSFLNHPGGDFEILEDIMPTGRTMSDGPGSTTGDNKAIANFVARRGPGLHHVAFRVADISAAIAQAKDAGVTMIDNVGRPGSRRALIAFGDRRTTGGVVFHFVERPDGNA